MASTSSGNLIQVKASGLMCSFCTMSVEKALGKVPGVNNVQVNLVHGIILVDADRLRGRGRRAPVDRLSDPSEDADGGTAACRQRERAPLERRVGRGRSRCGSPHRTGLVAEFLPHRHLAHGTPPVLRGIQVGNEEAGGRISAPPAFSPGAGGKGVS